MLLVLLFVMTRNKQTRVVYADKCARVREICFTSTKSDKVFYVPLGIFQSVIPDQSVHNFLNRKKEIQLFIAGGNKHATECTVRLGKAVFLVRERRG